MFIDLGSNSFQNYFFLGLPSDWNIAAWVAPVKQQPHLYKSAGKVFQVMGKLLLSPAKTYNYHLLKRDMKPISVQGKEVDISAAEISVECGVNCLKIMGQTHCTNSNVDHFLDPNVFLLVS